MDGLCDFIIKLVKFVISLNLTSENIVQCTSFTSHNLCVCVLDLQLTDQFVPPLSAGGNIMRSQHICGYYFSVLRIEFNRQCSVTVTDIEVIKIAR